MIPNHSLVWDGLKFSFLTRELEEAKGWLIVGPVRVSAWSCFSGSNFALSSFTILDRLSENPWPSAAQHGHRQRQRQRQRERERESTEYHRASSTSSAPAQRTNIKHPSSFCSHVPFGFLYVVPIVYRTLRKPPKIFKTYLNHAIWISSGSICQMTSLESFHVAAKISWMWG